MIMRFGAGSLQRVLFAGLLFFATSHCSAQSKQPFKVIAFYTAKEDQAHRWPLKYLFYNSC